MVVDYMQENNKENKRMRKQFIDTNVNQSKNCRQIYLTQTSFKIYTRILERKLRELVKSKLKQRVFTT